MAVRLNDNDVRLLYQVVQSLGGTPNYKKLAEIAEADLGTVRMRWTRFQAKIAAKQRGDKLGRQLIAPTGPVLLAVAEDQTTEGSQSKAGRANKRKRKPQDSDEDDVDKPNEPVAPPAKRSTRTAKADYTDHEFDYVKEEDDDSYEQDLEDAAAADSVTSDNEPIKFKNKSTQPNKHRLQEPFELAMDDVEDEARPVEHVRKSGAGCRSPSRPEAIVASIEHDEPLTPPATQNKSASNFVVLSSSSESETEDELHGDEEDDAEIMTAQSGLDAAQSEDYLLQPGMQVVKPRSAISSSRKKTGKGRTSDRLRSNTAVPPSDAFQHSPIAAWPSTDELDDDPEAVQEAPATLGRKNENKRSAWGLNLKFW